jgi:Zn-dependent protease with chaperone function
MTAPVPTRTIRSLGDAPLDIRPWLALAWMSGSAAVLWWRAVQWRALRAALAGAAPATVPVGLPAFAATTRGGPAVVGFLRPVLMLPQGLAERLTPAELEAVLEHELHHARRRDNLLALPLLLAQALFWFHPLVWWIGRRLLAERERACDEAVLQGGIDAETYARALLEVCRLELTPAPALAAAALGGAKLKRRIRRIMADRPPRPLGAPGGLILTAALAAAVAAPVLAGVFSAAPEAAARVLATLSFPIAPPRPSTPLAPRPADPATSPPRAPARTTLVPDPAVAEVAYAPPAAHALRLARGTTALPAFQPAAAEPAAAVATPAVDGGRPSADASVLRALADRTAYVEGADLGNVRLDLRGAGACPTAGVLDAERRLGGQTISTAFDGRVRRFVDEALAGRAPRNLSPAMAMAVDKTLPALQPALAARFAAPGEARLIGEDRRGRDVYLLRPGGSGYVLVLVDDLGQIEAALFCAGG